MIRLSQAVSHRSFSPRARAVLLFAGLGLLYTLITSLVFPSNWEHLYIHVDGGLRWRHRVTLRSS